MNGPPGEDDYAHEDPFEVDGFSRSNNRPIPKLRTSSPPSEQQQQQPQQQVDLPQTPMIEGILANETNQNESKQPSEILSNTSSTIADLPSTDVQSLFLQKSNLTPFENSDVFRWKDADVGGGGGGGAEKSKQKSCNDKNKSSKLTMTPSMIKDLPSTSSLVVLDLKQKELKPIEQDEKFMYSPRTPPSYPSTSFTSSSPSSSSSSPAPKPSSKAPPPLGATKIKRQATKCIIVAASPPLRQQPLPPRMPSRLQSPKSQMPNSLIDKPSADYRIIGLPPLAARPPPLSPTPRPAAPKINENVTVKSNRQAEAEKRKPISIIITSTTATMPKSPARRPSTPEFATQGLTAVSIPRQKPYKSRQRTALRKTTTPSIGGSTPPKSPKTSEIPQQQPLQPQQQPLPHKTKTLSAKNSNMLSGIPDSPIRSPPPPPPPPPQRRTSPKPPPPGIQTIKKSPPLSKTVIIPQIQQQSPQHVKACVGQSTQGTGNKQKITPSVDGPASNTAGAATMPPAKPPVSSHHPVHHVVIGKKNHHNNRPNKCGALRKATAATPAATMASTNISKIGNQSNNNNNIITVITTTATNTNYHKTKQQKQSQQPAGASKQQTITITTGPNNTRITVAAGKTTNKQAGAGGGGGVLVSTATSGQQQQGAAAAKMATTTTTTTKQTQQPNQQNKRTTANTLWTYTSKMFRPPPKE